MLNHKVLFGVGWNFMENANKMTLQYAHSQDLQLVAVIPNSFERQYQIIYKPNTETEIRQVYQFVDTGLMTLGQPTGLTPEGAISNTEIEYGGHDWVVELKRTNSSFQKAYSVS